MKTENKTTLNLKFILFIQKIEKLCPFFSLISLFCLLASSSLIYLMLFWIFFFFTVAPSVYRVYVWATHLMMMMLLVAVASGDGSKFFFCFFAFIYIFIFFFRTSICTSIFIWLFASLHFSCWICSVQHTQLIVVREYIYIYLYRAYFYFFYSNIRDLILN